MPDASLAAMPQTVSEREITRTRGRAALRVVNAVPPLKRRLFRRMGEE